jgi:general secretion pathway protein J
VTVDLAMPGRNESGFTLIELLVTITLLSLLALVLFGGLHFGIRAWEGASANSAGADDLRVVQNILRREIEQAYPYYASDDPLHPEIDFRGDDHAMTFLAPAPQVMERSARYRITVAEERSAGDVQLAIRAAPELATTGNSTWSAPLLRNLAAVRFSFLGPDGWHDAWKNRSTLPSLVRVRVTFRRGDSRFWPDLIVAPRIAADAGCVYDYVTKRCHGRS